MDGQTTGLLERAENIGKRILADAEKIGHETLAEIERLLGIGQPPAAAPATAEPAQPAATTAAPTPQA